MPFDVQRMLSLGRVSQLAISPRGEWAAVAVARVDPERAKFVSSLWRVPLDGGAPTQLTRGVNDDRSPAFRADGALLFVSDRKRSAKDDDARSQVWALLPDGGEPVPLTDEPLGVDAFKVGGDRLVVLAHVLPNVASGEQRARAKDRAEKGPSALRYTKNPVRHWDHWLGVAAPHVIAYDSRGEGRRDLTPAADREYRGDLEWDLSADGSTIALIERTLGADRCHDQAVRVIDSATGASRLLGAAPLTMLDHVRLSPSGRVIACTHQLRSRASHGKVSLVLVDAASGALRTLGADWDRWPIPQSFVDEGTLLATADDQGTVPLFSVDVATDRFTRLTPATSGGAHASPIAHGGLVFGLRHTVLAPPELFRAPRDRESAPEVFTDLSGFSREFADAAVVTQMRVRSTDGTDVHSYVVAPKGVAKPPVLLWIHGGPIGAFGDQWHWRWNPLVMVAAGYAVALPNAKGSTGYGQAHVEGIWRNSWGGQCYEDLMATADALEKRDDLDGTRIAAMGGSFGGYMANWIGGQTTRFRALVTHASIFHLEMFAGTTDYGAYFQLELDASPRADLDVMNRYSPHRFVKNWRTPTLILHGEKDYRVPIHDALALFEALDDLGVDSELVVFPDENHWIGKPRNVQAWYETILAFLDRTTKARTV